MNRQQEQLISGTKLPTFRSSMKSSVILATLGLLGSMREQALADTPLVEQGAKSKGANSEINEENNLIAELREKLEARDKERTELLKQISEFEDLQRLLANPRDSLIQMVKEVREVQKRLLEESLSVNLLNLELSEVGAINEKMNEEVIELKKLNEQLKLKLDLVTKLLNEQSNWTISSIDVSITTSNIKKAGTNAKPSLIIRYSGGEFIVPLPNLPGNDNERGKTTTWMNVPLGRAIPAKIDEILLTHNNAGKGPGWSVDQILITAPIDNHQTSVVLARASLNRWLSHGHGMVASIPLISATDTKPEVRP